VEGLGEVHNDMVKHDADVGALRMPMAFSTNMEIEKWIFWGKDKVSRGGFRGRGGVDKEHRCDRKR
jgi:hypothetical protein